MRKAETAKKCKLNNFAARAQEQIKKKTFCFCCRGAFESLVSIQSFALPSSHRLHFWEGSVSIYLSISILLPLFCGAIERMRIIISKPAYKHTSVLFKVVLLACVAYWIRLS